MTAIAQQIEVPEMLDAFVYLSNQVYRRKSVHLKPEKAYCSKCNSPIAWVMLENNRRHPINWIWDGKRGNLVYSGEIQRWRIVKNVELDSYFRLGGFAAKSHFETCPFADEFRKKNK